MEAEILGERPLGRDCGHPEPDLHTSLRSGLTSSLVETVNSKRHATAAYDSGAPHALCPGCSSSADCILLFSDWQSPGKTDNPQQRGLSDLVKRQKPGKVFLKMGPGGRASVSGT